MRILHVINSIGVREGAELSLIEILTGTTSDFDHTVAVLDAHDADVGALASAGIQVLRPATPIRSRVGHVKFVVKAVGVTRPDLIHSSLFDADQAARLGGLLTRRPVVSSLVNMPYSPEAFAAELVPAWKLRLVRSIDTFTSRHLTVGFHAITEAVGTHAVDNLGIDPRSLRVVPRGRSRNRLGSRTPKRRADVRAAMGWTGRQIILNVARQEPQKGQHHLINVLPDVLAKFPNLLLVVAGRAGRSTETLRRRTEELSLGPHVVFLDVRDDVPDLMVGADVFAFPSLFEGLGGALIEAMALELPIVAFDTPAVNEALSAGSCGRLVPPGDTNQLGRALREALDAIDDASSMTIAARHRFEEVYRLESCLEQMRLFYLDVEKQLPYRRRHGLCLRDPSSR